MSKTHIRLKRIWAFVMLMVLLFGIVMPLGTVTAYADSGTPCMEFTFNGTPYAIYNSTPGSGTGVSWTCDADGNYAIKFTQSGTFTITRGIITGNTATVIGGGGGGTGGTTEGGGNGGGGGQKVTQSVPMAVGNSFNVVIGAGGGAGANGQASSFGSVSANGGTAGAGGAGGPKHAFGYDNSNGSAGTGRDGGGGAWAGFWMEDDCANFRSGGYGCFCCGTCYIAGGLSIDDIYSIPGWTPLYQHASWTVTFRPRGGAGGSEGGASGADACNDHCTGDSNGRNAAANTGGGGGGGSFATWMYYMQGGSRPYGYYAGRGGSGGSGVVMLSGNSIGPVGELVINKTSSNTTLSSGNLCYTLNGAVYGVFNSEADALAGRNPVTTLTTNDAGVTSAATIGIGSYFVKEITAPAGFALDTQVYPIEILEDQRTFLDVEDDPISDPISILVSKTDAATGTGTSSGAASLAGAQFSISFYAGQYATAADAEASGAPAKSWVFQTNDDGFIMLSDPSLVVSGDDFYLAENGNITFPLGTLVIQEIKAPEHYFIDDTKYVAHITEDGSDVALIESYNAPTVPNTLIHGGVSQGKVDAEVEDGPQGDATLAGAVFSIYNNNDVNVTVNGVSCAPGTVVATMTTDETGFAQTAEDLLPLGKYILRETAAPAGYAVNTTYERAFEITENGMIYSTTEVIQEDVLRGGISITKEDSTTNLTTPQGDGSFAGITFDITNASALDIVYNGKSIAPGEYVTSMVTDDTGVATAEDLPYGTYTITEKSVPAETGYALNEGWSATVEVREGDVIVAGDNCPNTLDLFGRIEVQKVDGPRNTAIAEGDATLKGAQFEISNGSKYPVVVNGKTYNVGDVITTITTDDNGVATTPENLKLPIGTYKIRETAPSTGYLLNEEWVGTAVIRTNGETASVDVDCPETPITGGVSVQKLDKDTGTNVGTGGMLMDNAEFTIINRSQNAVVYDGRVIEPYEGEFDRTSTSDAGIVTRIYTDAEAFATTGANELPYGTYEIIETDPPAGYLINEEWSKTFQIRKDGEIIAFDGDDACVEELCRIDIHFEKINAKTGETLPNVVFRVTNVDTGESHIIVTDPNGVYDSSYIPHSQRTNANDAAVDAEGNVDEEKLNYESGTWFGGGTVYDEYPDGSRLGAYVYGTYRFEELRTSANEGLTLVTFEKLLYVRDAIMDLGHIEDHVPPDIGTTLTDKASNSHQSNPSEYTTLVDTVAYENLMTGKEYTLEGILMDKATGEPALDANGEQITATKTFTAKSENGTINVEFVFDSTALAGHTLVAYEYLYVENNDEEIAYHIDITDVDQSVYFPDIHTTATVDGRHEALADGKITLVDTITYDHLEAGAYTASGVLMDKTTGEPVYDKRGNEVTAEAKFVTTGGKGTVDVTFTFDASALAGTSVVAFETLYDAAGNVVGRHEDIDDEDQTVDFPGIKTTLTDKNGSHDIQAEGTVTLTDTVEYTNLTVGNTYTMEGTLMNKSTGKAVEDAEGNPITASKEFTPEAESGTVEITFSFDVSKMAGGSVVAFETLYDAAGNVVGKHEDINDEDQTVHVPEIGTTLTGEDGTHEVAASDGKVTLTDIIKYENLIPGKEYTAEGTLMSKTTGKAITDKEGNPITATTTFTPETADGTVEVKFKLDVSEMAGDSIVAFEKVSNDLGIVAKHEDIDDENQTVHVPEIGTTLTSEDGSHDGIVDEEITLTDTVEYKSLIPGKTYTMEGTLINKATGKALKDSEGDKIIVAKTFTPETPDGTVEISFTIDSSTLAGNSVVAYETLYNELGIIAEHKDINDEGQTVHFPEIATTLTSESGTHDALAEGTVTLKDTVTYKNLIPGKTYTMEGTLMDKATGKAIEDATGKTITASTEFTPEKADGSVEVSFTFDISKLAGHSIVAFEKLYNEFGVIAKHEDISDEDQTVYVPDIRTSAADENGNKEIEAVTKVTIVDTVTYTNLIPGEKYTVTGKLMDKESEEPVTDSSGKEITAQTSFKPKTADGTVEVKFTLDASDLVGKEVVVFENLYRGDVSVEANIVAKHEDIDDEDQTVEFKYSGKITKIDATSEEALEGVNILVIDKTSGEKYDCTTDSEGYAYFALIPGHSYTYQEISTLDDYILDETVYEFSVNDKGEIVGDDLILRNIRFGTVVITKTDVITGEPVQGAAEGKTKIYRY